MGNQLIAAAADVGTGSDQELIMLVRGGRSAAFEELFRRHKQAAESMARRESDNPSDAEDIAAEAFLSVLASLCAGKGPDQHFRSYLLTVTRRMAHRRNTRARRLAQLAHDRALEPAGIGQLPDLEPSMLARAFESLPPRWQTVLRCVDIQGMAHAEAAAYVNVGANGVASLLVRARKGLRLAYLREEGEGFPAPPGPRRPVNRPAKAIGD